MSGASEDRVRPNGVIVYEFDLAVSLFSWIDEQLVLVSPVKTGKYKKSHRFYADGVEVDPLRPPMNATEYMTDKGLHALIRDPKSVRFWPGMKMQGWSEDLLSDREIDHIIAYLKHMAGRKTAP